MELWSLSSKHWNSCPILKNIGSVIIFPLQTLEFCPIFLKNWNSHLILPTTGILALFYTHWFLLSDPSKYWNYYAIFIHIGFLIFSLKPWDAFPISISIGIMILFLRTLEFWPYFYEHCNSYLIVPNTGILALFLYTLEYNSYFILPKIGHHQVSSRQ